MEKRAVIFSLMALLLLNFVSAACTLTPSLVNQDPYPAVPGDYVKLVFQLSGVSNPECRTVNFELLPEYPISFDPGVSSVVVANAGTYAKDFSSYLIIPYKVRIDPNALDGDVPLEVRYGTNLSGFLLSQQFNMTVKDVRSDFEVFIKNYDYATHIMTLEILNVGKNDVKSLTISIFNGEHMAVKGASTSVVGSLDSNDFTTTDFEVIPSEGDTNLSITYTDPTDTRRTIEKTIHFDPSLFEDRQKDQKSGSSIYYIIIVIIVGGIIYYFYRKRKHERKKKLGI